MDKARKVATRLAKSTKARDKFFAMATALGETTSIPENFCVTRWAGAYILMKSYVENTTVIKNNTDMSHLAPTSGELELGNACIEILKDAYNAIPTLEGDESTASSIIGNISWQLVPS
ncbi:unnamed protein product [Caenorhabditis brenneri]